MARGGARNRSGPQPDPNSARSDQRGYKLTALPAAGYDGEAPDWPLPIQSAREAEVWEEAWATPQACAWSTQWWRHRTVAMWVRWSVRMEDPEAPAALGNVVVRLADQIGMTPAGLKENGWAIAPAEQPKAEEKPATAARPQRRLRVVPNG